MAAAFTYAIRYDVTAVCLTPLRSGGTDGSADAVLRTADGTAFLQGTSLAGAFRAWLADPRQADALFGTQKQEGSLILSDGLFAPDASQSIRPRLRICGATGAAEPGGKFDVAHIDAGETFAFSVIWRGTSPESEEIAAAEQMLAALHAGEIRLGAQKSSGFGQVRLCVKKRVYYLCDEADRTAWLNDSDDGVAYALPEAKKVQNVVFTVRGHMKSVLVKSGGAKQLDSGSMAVNLEEGGTPLIPGSSVKGAVRARAKAIAPHCRVAPEEFDAMFGRGAKAGEDNGVAGKICFSDVRLEQAKGQKISRIRINAFTGGVMRGGLFSEEPLSSDVELKITAPNDGQTCRLLLYALRDLGLGLYGLGSGGAIGRGLVTEVQICMEAPDGRQARLTFDGQRRSVLDDPQGLAGEWLKGGTEG